MSNGFTKVILCMILLVSACGELTDPYGEEGWRDADGYSGVTSVNSNGDTLSTTALKMFGRVSHLYSLQLFDTSSGGSCEKSETGITVFESGKQFLTSISFQFPEDSSKNFMIDTVLIYGFDKEKPNQENSATIFFGEQFLPKDAIDKFSFLNKLDVMVTDKCGNSYTRNFNISGDVKHLSLTSDERKQAAQDAEAEKEFE